MLLPLIVLGLASSAQAESCASNPDCDGGATLTDLSRATPAYHYAGGEGVDPVKNRFNRLRKAGEIPGSGPLRGSGVIPPAPAVVTPAARVESESTKGHETKEEGAGGHRILSCLSREEEFLPLVDEVRQYLVSACQEDQVLVAVYDAATGFFTTLSGTLTQAPQTEPQRTAFAFLAAHPSLFGVVDPANQLQLVPDRSHLDNKHKALKFVQVFEGRPVYGGSVSVSIDGQGVVRSISNSFKPSIYENRVRSHLKLSPKAIEAIIAKDLKLAPPSTEGKGTTESALQKKTAKVKPLLVYVPYQGGWRLAYQHLIAIWERGQASEPKKAPQSLRPAGYEYWIDAEDGRLLLKRDAGYYCDNSKGLVETPVSQLIWNDRGRVPFNTCEGWKWKITKKGMRRITYYLEDHTRSGVIETYDIRDVGIVKIGYNSFLLPYGWPTNTPTDENDIWNDHGAADVPTTHWAAQQFRDFLIEEFGRDQIHGDNDIDIGSNSPSRSMTFPWIDTATVTRGRSGGIDEITHELMHLVTYYESPGAGFSQYYFDDHSIGEHISDLFEVFTQYRKSPYRTLRMTPWCNAFDASSVEFGEDHWFNSILTDDDPDARGLREAFRTGRPFDYSMTKGRYCGHSAPTPIQLCYHMVFETLSPECQPDDKYDNYSRAGPAMRAGLLLSDGGTLYRDMERDASGRPSYTHQAAPPNTETDFDNQLVIQPIGMEKLMQISYKTVREKLDAGMRYEDWAARQLASALELGYPYVDQCNIMKAYAAVGLGESHDWDCDGIHNDQDEWMDLDDRALFSPVKDHYYVEAIFPDPTNPDVEDFYTISTYLFRSQGERIGNQVIQDNAFTLDVGEGDSGNRFPCSFFSPQRTSESPRRLSCDIPMAQVRSDTNLQIHFASGGYLLSSPLFTGAEIIRRAQPW